ncbi:hypothetical protein RZS08_35175, partial [Arthrospira platensis SPKY1]|nr:hypothetical protein [Arthrospira platensis SPKY1]
DLQPAQILPRRATVQTPFPVLDDEFVPVMSDDQADLFRIQVGVLEGLQPTRGPFPAALLQPQDPLPLPLGQPALDHDAALARRGLPRMRSGRSVRIDLH